MLETERRAVEKLQRELGSQLLEFLNSADVIEIVLNADGGLWVERLGQPMLWTGTMAPANAEAIISTVAAMLRTTVNRDNPILECELPLDGSRFEALVPPVVSRPIFSIRRRASRVFSLADYVGQGILKEAQATALERAISERLNIVVVGGTGSGKTTLANALIASISTRHPEDRLVILEDTVELQCQAPNAALLRTTDTVSMQRLLRATMRLRPDRIVIGEVRGGEALDLLKAWNTGHPGGVATLHANSAQAGLARLEQLLGETSQKPMETLIGETVDVVAFIQKTPQGRRLKELLRVEGFQNGRYSVSRLEAC